MGIFEEISTTDSLGRRTGPRTRHTLEQKLRVLEEVRTSGTSVAVVARRNGLNANQVFGWRRQQRRGLLSTQSAKGDAKMLPVEVGTPTVLPTERAAAVTLSRQPRSEKPTCLIEIRLRNGHAIVLHGQADGEALSSVIDLLIKR
jgi:transposase